jgi:hypothetical protein
VDAGPAAAEEDPLVLLLRAVPSPSPQSTASAGQHPQPSPAARPSQVDWASLYKPRPDPELGEVLLAGSKVDPRAPSSKQRPVVRLPKRRLMVKVTAAARKESAAAAAASLAVVTALTHATLEAYQLLNPAVKMDSAAEAAGALVAYPLLDPLLAGEDSGARRLARRAFDDAGAAPEPDDT